MDPTAGDQLEREAADGPAEAPGDRSRGDRAQEALLDEPLDAFGRVLERRTALGVREHDLMSAAADVGQHRVEVAGSSRERALDEEVGAPPSLSAVSSASSRSRAVIRSTSAPGTIATSTPSARNAARSASTAAEISADVRR